MGATFNVQTYPGLVESLAQDFEGLRSKLYALHPEWKGEGKLDGGVEDLDKISKGLTLKFLTIDDGTKTNLTKKELLSLPFRFDVFGTATPLTRAEFVAEQIVHAQKLRQAILADDKANDALKLLAAEENQCKMVGWLL